MSHFLDAVVEGAVDFHFHRAGGDMELFRDLGIGTKFQPGRDQHLSLSIRQFTDDPHELPDLVAVDYLLVRTRALVANGKGILDLFGCGPVPAAPPVIDGQRPGDALEIRHWCCGCVRAVSRQLDPRLMGKILGILARAVIRVRYRLISDWVFRNAERNLSSRCVMTDLEIGLQAIPRGRCEFNT